MAKYSSRSLKILKQAHPDLSLLFKNVIKETDCSIICSNRNKKDQEKAFSDGFSKAHFGESPHNYLPSLAVDAVPYPSLWSDKEKLKKLGEIVKRKAKELGIEIEWGGDWNWKDYPHYQLKNWKSYIKK
jgi:peptidoglycan L-alanyl-D-glutamate endopeptidase CwlK